MKILLSLVLSTKIQLVLSPNMSQSFNCTYQDCTKTYNKKSRLDEHLNTHTLNKPFKCNKCSKSYYKKYHLQRHYFSHSGERRYTCERCGSGHNERSKLREHEKKCGLKFVCEKCKRVFLREGRYRTHVCKISADFDKENCNDNFQDAKYMENDHIQTDDDTRYLRDLNYNYINYLDKNNKMNIQESKILSQDRSNNYINNLNNYKQSHLQNLTNMSQGYACIQAENNEHSLINAVVLSACSIVNYDIFDDLNTQIKNLTNLIRKNNLHAFNAKQKLKINNIEIKIDKDIVKKAKLDMNALAFEQSFDDMVEKVEMREISENQMNKNHNNNNNARRMYEMKHDNSIDNDSKNLIDKPTNSNNIINNDQTKIKISKKIENNDETKKNSEINDTNKCSKDKFLFTNKINNSVDISNVTNEKFNDTSTIKDTQNNQNINNSNLIEKMNITEQKNQKKFKKNKNKNSLTCNNQFYDLTTEINEDNSGSKLNLNNNSFESDNSINGINEIDEINKIFSLNSFETTHKCNNEINVNKYKLPHVNDVVYNSLDNSFSKLYECLHCDKTYTTRKILKAHIDSVHISGKKHKCKCGKEYFYRHNLKQHEMKCQQA